MTNIPAPAAILCVWTDRKSCQLKGHCLKKNMLNRNYVISLKCWATPCNFYETRQPLNSALAWYMTMLAEIHHIRVVGVWKAGILYIIQQDCLFSNGPPTPKSATFTVHWVSWLFTFFRRQLPRHSAMSSPEDALTLFTIYLCRVNSRFWCRRMQVIIVIKQNARQPHDFRAHGKSVPAKVPQQIIISHMLVKINFTIYHTAHP